MAKKKKLPKAQFGFMEYITGSPYIMGSRDNWSDEDKTLENSGTPPTTIKATDYIGDPMGYFNAKAKERQDAAFASKYRNINGELD
tara:strand:+ start:3893 stop:4150 length:258 start_codon:yes stop_codon:yes gene_type:complete